MGSIFNIDGPLMRTLTRIADLAVLNIIWLITCIPVITIGAADIAMYTVLIRMKEQREGNVLKQYLSAFKENFKPGLIIELILVVLAGILALEYFFVKNAFADDKTISILMYAFIAILAILWLMMYSLVPALYARYENTVAATLMNSILIGIGGLVYTIPVLVITIAPVLLMLFATNIFIRTFILWLIIGVAGIRYLNVWLIAGLFGKMEK